MKNGVTFVMPIGGNQSTSSGNGAFLVRWKRHERFCMLGWHWVDDSFGHNVVRTVCNGVYRWPHGMPVQACQKCMRHWHATGRVHVGSLSRTATFLASDFRARHLARIELWNNRAPMIKDGGR